MSDKLKECEDCGDEMTGEVGQARRKRYPTCGLLLCGWCWHHIHNLCHGWAKVDHAGAGS